MRSNWAIPRASLRSVFMVIADNAAFTCRVSSSTTSKPALIRPSRSHWDRPKSGPSLRPCPDSCRGASGPEPGSRCHPHARGRWPSVPSQRQASAGCSAESPQPRTAQQNHPRHPPFRYPSETSKENSPLRSSSEAAYLNGMQTPDTSIRTFAEQLF